MRHGSGDSGIPIIFFNSDSQSLASGLGGNSVTAAAQASASDLSEIAGPIGEHGPRAMASAEDPDLGRDGDAVDPAVYQRRLYLRDAIYEVLDTHLRDSSID
eukprot:SAG11_NODE_10480_length_828_cov_5.238683_1_plen_102_part_00